MTSYSQIQNQLRHQPRTWLVTGAAGFIASNIVEELLRLEQNVVGLDDFSTGHQRNLDEVQAAVMEDQWARFVMARGDVTNLDQCRDAAKGADYVLHHAAVGSVPRSIDEPL